VQAPALEALGARLSRIFEWLAGAIASAALLVGGSMLLMTSMGGWHDTLGDLMVISGISGMLIIRVAVWLRNRRSRR
jgi:hypothetical protein